MRGMAAIKRFDMSGIPYENFRWRGFEGDTRNAVLRGGRFYDLLAGFVLPAKIPAIPCSSGLIPCFGRMNSLFFAVRELMSNLLELLRELMQPAALWS